MKLDTPWFKDLVEDLQGAITEGVFNSRWLLIETYHSVGEKIRRSSDAHKIMVTDLVNDCAVNMKVSTRKLWYAVKFFDKFPKLDTLPEGKVISWHKIKTKYLTEGEKEEKECIHEAMVVCRKCKKELKELDTE